MMVKMWDCFYGQQPWFLDRLDSSSTSRTSRATREHGWNAQRLKSQRGKDDNGGRKYQLSNASPDATMKRLAEMSCSRYWIERAFEDAKGELGMADYEVRGWTGWHHHITMVLLAMLFLTILQLKWKEKALMLTIQDVRGFWR